MIDLHRLSLVLKHANATPPAHAREEFYALKQAILERYGIRCGYDVQEIVHKCWGYRYDPCDANCEKCDGTGIFEKKVILLERWQLAGQVFHRPLQRLPVAFSEVAPTIHGKIAHRIRRLGFACWRVLSILFRPQFYLYLDQFRMDEKQLRRFKAVLAYLLGFSRTKWQVRAITFSEIEEAASLAKVQKRRDQLIPF